MWLIVILAVSTLLTHVAATAPNIILYLTDDLGIGDIATPQGKMLGHHEATPTTHRTPHINNLASEGIYFDRSYTGGNVCGPSRYQLLTGIPTGTKYSIVRGNTKPFRVKPANEVLFPEVLKAAGYYTMGFGKFGFGHNISPTKLDTPSAAGFDSFVGFRTHRDAHHRFPSYLCEDKNDGGGFKTTTSLTPRNHALRITNTRREDRYCNIYNAKKKTIRVKGTLASQLGEDCDFVPDILHKKSLAMMRAKIKENKPFFNMFASTIPHAGGRNDGGRACFNRDGPTCFPIPQVTSPWDVSNMTDNIFLNARASSIMNYLDVHVGETVDMLKEEGVWNNTIFIFTSDNGPSTATLTHINSKGDNSLQLDTIDSNGRFDGMKRSLGEGGIRVPLLMSWPDKFVGGGIAYTPITLADISTTLFDAVGLFDQGWTVPEPKQFSGMSFLPSLLNPNGTQDEQHRFIISELCVGARTKKHQNRNCDFVYFFGDNLQYKRYCSRIGSGRYPVTMNKKLWTLKRRTKGARRRWVARDHNKCSMGKKGDGYFNIKYYTNEQPVSRVKFTVDGNLYQEAKQLFVTQYKGNGAAVDYPWPNIDLTTVPNLAQ